MRTLPQAASNIIQAANQRMNIRLNIIKNFKSSYQKEKRCEERYYENWIFHKKNSLFHCGTYEMEPGKMERLFRMTTDDSAVTLFDAYFAVQYTNMTTIKILFSQWYDSATKQEEVLDELVLLKLNGFKGEKDDDNEALTKLVDRIARLYPLSIPSDRKETIGKDFLKYCKRFWLGTPRRQANWKHAMIALVCKLLDLSNADRH